MINKYITVEMGESQKNSRGILSNNVTNVNDDCPASRGFLSFMACIIFKVVHMASLYLGYFVYAP